MTVMMDDSFVFFDYVQKCQEIWKMMKHEGKSLVYSISMMDNYQIRKKISTQQMNS